MLVSDKFNSLIVADLILGKFSKKSSPKGLADKFR
jgi:hypothetical protein